jgi:hypothetical protein
MIYIFQVEIDISLYTNAVIISLIKKENFIIFGANRIKLSWLYCYLLSVCIINKNRHNIRIYLYIQLVGLEYYIFKPKKVKNKIL